VDIVDTALNSVVEVRLFLGCVTCNDAFSDDDQRSILCFVLAILDPFLLLSRALYVGYYRNIHTLYIRRIFFLYLLTYTHIHTHTIRDDRFCHHIPSSNYQIERKIRTHTRENHTVKKEVNYAIYYSVQKKDEKKILKVYRDTFVTMRL